MARGRRAGNYIVVVRTGGEDLRKVRAQYKSNIAGRLCEPLVILHPFNMAESLAEFAGGVLSTDDVKYLLHNFEVFRTQAHYWRSCVQMGRTRVIFCTGACSLLALATLRFLLPCSSLFAINTPRTCSKKNVNGRQVVRFSAT